MCLQYLTFKCFDEDIHEGTLSELALTRILSFQDYAIAKWIDHILAIVQTAPDDVYKGEGYKEALEIVSKGITYFADRYQLEVLPQGDILEPVREDFRHVGTNHEFYEDLLNLYNHIYVHNKKESAERNKASIGSLGEILTRNRTMLESLPPPKTNSQEETDDPTEYYGYNRFKCPKIACYYFHEGFKDAKSRDEHVKRHDRPYVCAIPGCFILEFGFATNREAQQNISCPD